jgi:CO/xanthine dehydrogenase FAD-binding subunit
MSLPTSLNKELAYPSEYIFPSTVEEAVQTLANWEGAARLIAGGTDLMLELGKGKIRPSCFVSTERIHGLNQITVEDDFIEIGAAVTFANLKNHPYINQHVHALADAARSVGSLSIQNVATLAGNIVNAMPAADGVVAAIALESEAQVVDTEGSEWKPVETLFLGPGSSTVDPTRQLLSCIRFPRCEQRRGTAWYRIGRRPSLTLPILNCAVNVYLDKSGQMIERARIALGPVAPRPFRTQKAERFLAGRPITDANLKQAAEIAQKETSPRGNILRASREYRIATIPVIVENALSCAVQRALQNY